MGFCNSIGAWTVIGIGVGAALGAAMNETAAAVGVGAALGVAVGLLVNKRRRGA